MQIAASQDDLCEDVFMSCFEKRALDLTINQRQFAALMLASNLNSTDSIVQRLLQALGYNCCPQAITPALQAVDKICKLNASNLSEDEALVALTSFELLRAIEQLDDLMLAFQFLIGVSRDFKRLGAQVG